VTPGKGAQKQAHDRRTVGLWLEVVPGNRLASALTSSDASAFIAHRKARGDLRPGPKGALRGTPVRPRSWQIDLGFLKAVLRWGRAVGLVESDPGVLHFRDRTRAEVRRPNLSRAEAAQFLNAGHQISKSCFCFFVVAHETGHRVGAIRQLRWSDVDWVGAMVRWRPELDKTGKDHETPLTQDALFALRLMQAHSGAIGDILIFQAPKAPGRPISRNLVRDWWERMEDIVKLPGRERRGWHSLRRKFATDLKKICPLSDIARLGGWANGTTILRSYMQADPETMRQALEERPGGLSVATAEGTAEVAKANRKNQQPRRALTQSGAVS
jgi:integrase